MTVRFGKPDCKVGVLSGTANRILVDPKDTRSVIDKGTIADGPPGIVPSPR
jgi:hypothetical protein